MNRSPTIRIGHGRDPYDVTRRTLAHLDPEPVAGRSILIKPRTTHPLQSASDGFTHPRVLEAAIDWFRENGACAVAVADSQPLGSAFTSETEPSTAFAPQLVRLCREKDVLLVDIDHHDMIWLDIPGGKDLQRILTTRLLVDYDFIVSMPIMSTSRLSGAALSLENLHGLAGRHHKLYFTPRITVETPNGIIRRDQALADIAQVLYPDLVIIDGFNGMEGDEPSHGSPKNTGLIAAGYDALNADMTVARLMGIDPEQIDHLRYFRETSAKRLEPATIAPHDWMRLQTVFRPPQPRRRPSPLVRIINHRGCTSCQSAVYLFLEKHFTELSQGEELCFALGRDVDQGPPGIFYVGTCASSKDTKDTGYHCSGCPGQEEQIRETFRRVRSLGLTAHHEMIRSHEVLEKAVTRSHDHDIIKDLPQIASIIENRDKL